MGGHPNGIVFRVFKRNRVKSTSSSTAAAAAVALSMGKMEIAAATNQHGIKQRMSALSIMRPVKSSQLSAVSVIKKSLVIKRPSFISHPNGMVLRVFKKQRSMIEKTKITKPKFICHPNGMILKVLNQRSRKRKRSKPSSSSAAVVTTRVKMETETETETKMNTKTKTNRNAEQRVKKLKRAKQ